MKKIAIYTESFPPKSGGVAVAQYNIYHLLKNDYDIKVFVYYEEVNDNDNVVIKRKPNSVLFYILKKCLNLYFKKISFTERFDQTIDIFKTELSIRRLNKHLKAFDPDIILVPDHYLPARGIIKPAHSKLFWGAHHNYSRFTGNPLLETNGWADLHVCQAMETKTSNKADAIICPSDYMADVCRKTLNPNLPVITIYNFMVPDLIETITPAGNDRSFAGTKMVYIPSAGSIVKGKRYVFEIVRRLSSLTNNEISFYLSGHIPDDLQMELNSLKEAKIYSPGHLSWEQNLSVVKSCYIGITPNLVENFSYAILEAQTAGIPFIAFDTGGNKELIKDQLTGYIVHSLAIEQLLDRAVLLLKNEELRNSQSKTSEKHCKILFHPDTIKEQYQRILQSN